MAIYSASLEHYVRCRKAMNWPVGGKGWGASITEKLIGGGVNILNIRNT